MAVLRVKIDGVWTDLFGGADEVSIGPNTPTDPATELWYDSDDVAAAPTAAQIAYTPGGSIAATDVQAAITEAAVEAALGIVVKGTMVAMGGTAVAANVNTDITNVISYTPQLGRRYRLVANCRAVSSGTPGNARLFVTATGISLGGDNYTWIAGAYSAMRFESIFDGTGVASTFKISVGSGIAINVWTDQATGFFYLEDVGPAR